MKVLNGNMSYNLGARPTKLEESLVVDAALRLANNIIFPDDGGRTPAHSYSGVSGEYILFKRERPSYCRLCDRIHDNDNTLMIMIRDGVVTERCRRVQEGQVLGKLYVKEAVLEKRIRATIRKKLVTYKRMDLVKERCFRLHEHNVLELKDAQGNRCAACKDEMLWIFTPGDMNQFSIDRIDSKSGHHYSNVRLTCQKCNREGWFAKL